MSYDVYVDRGTKFYLCWNCGRIHIEEEETQQCTEDYKFISECLKKRQKEFEKEAGEKK